MGQRPVREQEREKKQTQRWVVRKDTEAAGYIHPLDRGFTWIGRMAEDSEAAGVARILLCVHQFQMIPAVTQVSLSHMLNSFLFGKYNS